MNTFYRYQKFNNPNITFDRNTPPSKTTQPFNKKINLKCLKNDACTSLYDVEHFLENFTSFIKYIKLYCLLKK